MRRRLCGAMIIPVALWTAGSWAAAPGAVPVRQTRDAPADISQYLPPGNGKALVVKECSGCHDPRAVVQLRASKPKWEAVVLDMVARGAPLMIDDADAIIDYLSEVFGPQAPPLVDINTATRDELVKLPGVTPTLADRLVAHRAKKGPILSRDEVREAIGLDAAAFEKIKWYMRTQKSPSAGQ